MGRKCTSHRTSLTRNTSYRQFNLPRMSTKRWSVYSVVPILQTGKCQVAVPCRGDRYVAGAQDGELIFSVRYERLDDLVDGLKAIAKAGTSLPGRVVMQPECQLPDSYVDLGREIGMDQLGN